MKTKLTTILFALTAGLAFGHGDIEIGPNKGRILEFSTNESMHGELTEKDGKLHIAVLDKDMKPVKVEAQSLTATGGTRDKPVKLEVTKSESGFTIAAPKNGEWLIIQYKESDTAKPITARMEYDAKKCGTCENVEWLCSCGAKK
ncbi:MAG: hypothetical protein V4640_01655 [Verrucomicrobiota bacterium]